MKLLIHLWVGLLASSAMAGHHEMSKDTPEVMHHHGDHKSEEMASHTNMGGHADKKGLIFYGDFAASTTYHSDENFGGPLTPDWFGAPGNNFQNGNFNGNLAEFNVEKNWGHSHFHFSFGAGQTLGDINRSGVTGAPSDRLFHITNAYYRLNSPYGLSLKTGLFESPMGYESFNHMDNAQFSRSYGFALVPYFHSGIALEYNFKDMVQLEAAVVNGVNGDELAGDSNKNKHGLFTAEIHPIENLLINLKYMGGVQTLPGDLRATQNTFEATVAYRVNEALDFAVDFTTLGSEIGDQDVASQSIAVYANGKIDHFGLGLRFEHFQTDNGAPFGVGTLGFANGAAGEDFSITSLTVTPSYMVDKNAKFLLEFRFDSSEDSLWAPRPDEIEAQNNSISATFGVMYRW